MESRDGTAEFGTGFLPVSANFLQRKRRMTAGITV